MYIDAIEKLASADIRNIDADSLIDAGDIAWIQIYRWKVVRSIWSDN